VSDPDGDAIESVTVGGVTAVVEPDGTWSATLDLTLGNNTFDVVAEDVRGAQGQAPSFALRRSEVLQGGSLRCEATGSAALALDTSGNLRRLDLETGELSSVSDSARGSGPEMGRAYRFAYDDSERAFVINEANAIFRVDLATGDRTLISNAATPSQPGGGPVLRTPADIIYDSESDRVLVSDTMLDAIIAIDPLTGVRSVLSASTLDGTRLGGAIAFDRVTDAVYAAGADSTLLRIDLNDGAREVFGESDDNLGFTLGPVSTIVADSTRNRLLVGTGLSIVEIDLATRRRRRVAHLTSNQHGLADVQPVGGDAVLFGPDARIALLPLELASSTTTLSSTIDGMGPNLSSPQIFASSVLNAGYALNRDRSVMRVDLLTGDRTLISSEARGAGVLWATPRALAIDEANRRMIVRDADSLTWVDITTGDRTLLAELAESVRGMSPWVDSARNELVLAAETRLLAVSLSNGAVTELSGAARGEGFLPEGFWDAVLFEGQYYATCETDAIIRIDPATGDRTVISGSMIGSQGPALTETTHIAVDGPSRAIIVHDRPASALVSIDIATGNRRLIRSDFSDFSASSIALDEDRARVLFTDSHGISWIELAARTTNEIYRRPARGQRPSSASIDAEGEMSCGVVGDDSDAACIDIASTEVTEFPSSYSPQQFPTGTYVDAASERAYLFISSLSPTDNASVISYDIDGDNPQVIVDDSRGQGPVVSWPIDGDLDRDRSRLLVLDSEVPALFAVDLASGDRQVLSGGSVGSGQPWDYPRAIRYDRSTDRAYVVDDRSVIAVDLASGDRSIIASPEVGGGPDPVDPIGIEIDPENDRLIVHDAKLGLLFVDLTTGDRTSVLNLGVDEDATEWLMPSGEVRYDPERRTLMVFTGTIESGAESALVEIDEISGDTLVLLGRAP
jgi:DNA-binding beta-propeller fold protein YncE